MLAPELDDVRTALPGVEHECERKARFRADGGAALKLVNLINCPAVKSFGAASQVGDFFGRIGLGQFGITAIPKHLPQQLYDLVLCFRGLCPLVSEGAHIAPFHLRIWLIATTDPIGVRAPAEFIKD